MCSLHDKACESIMDLFSPKPDKECSVPWMKPTWQTCSIDWEECILYSLYHTPCNVCDLMQILLIVWSISSGLASSDSSLQVEQFHRAFISYTIKHDFINLLYLYLDFYKWALVIHSSILARLCVCFRLALDGSSIQALGLSSPSLPPWVDLMLHCRLADQNPNGR